MKQLTPNLAVKDVAKSVTFYTEVLGFKLKMCVDDEKRPAETIEADKRYIWANVMNGSVGMMFQQKQSFEDDLGVLVKEIGASVSFYIEVEDAQVLYERLKEKATIHKTLETTFYGTKEFYIKDPDGYILGFSSRM